MKTWRELVRSKLKFHVSFIVPISEKDLELIE